jgi:Leucine-rich repeat (LRR) protein
MVCTNVRLADLVYLDHSISNICIRKQGLTEIPEVLFSFKNLEVLSLQVNQITFTEPGDRRIADLTGLRVLDLTFNSMTNIEILVRCLAGTRVEQLELVRNVVRDVPESIRLLPNLRMIDLSYNPLGSFPVTLVTTNLAYLGLAGCGLSEIPDLSSMTELRDLDVAQNKIETVIPEYLPKGLTSLNLMQNPLRDREGLLVALKEARPRLEVHIRSGVEKGLFGVRDGKRDLGVTSRQPTNDVHGK